MANFVINVVNALIKGLGAAIGLVINLLPASPFNPIDNSVVAPYLAAFNWFVPLNLMVAELEAWLVAVGIFYLYMIILRWIKALG